MEFKYPNNWAGSATLGNTALYNLKGLLLSGTFIDCLSSPMSQSKSIPGDTPVKQNTAATGVFINGNLDQQRTAVITDLGNIPEVTVDFMLDHIVPNSGIDVDRTMRNLNRKEVLLIDGWKSFIGAMPKESVDSEQTVFSKMATIYKEIIDSTEFEGRSSRRTRAATLDLGASPDIAPKSETNVKTRPDGCGQLVKSHPFHTSQCGYASNPKGEYHWLNIAYVEEYKKRNTVNDLNDVCPIPIFKLTILTH